MKNWMKPISLIVTALAVVGCTINNDEIESTHLWPQADGPQVLDLGIDTAFVRMARRSSHRLVFNSHLSLEDAIVSDPLIVQIERIVREPEGSDSATIRCVRSGSSVTLIATDPTDPGASSDAVATIVCVEAVVESELHQSQDTKYTFDGSYSFTFELVDPVGEPLMGTKFPLFDGPIGLRDLEEVEEVPRRSDSHRRRKVKVVPGKDTGQILLPSGEVNIVAVPPDDIDNLRLGSIEPDSNGTYIIEQTDSFALLAETEGNIVRRVTYDQLLTTTPDICEIVSWLDFQVVTFWNSGTCEIEFRASGASQTHSQTFEIQIRPQSP